MNNLELTSKCEPIRLVDDVEPFQDAYELTVSDDSLSLDLDDPDGMKRVEYRYHKRFQFRKNAVALIRSTSAEPLNIQDKSMGCIACAVFDAKPVRLGKIGNISMGGLMF